MPEKGDVLNGRYEILEKIGQGGMSTVYRAMDKRLGRVVALKVLKSDLSEDEEYSRNFLREARTTACIISPNVVATYDISGDEEPYRYLVMELVEGVTLKDYIAKKGPLSNDETIQIALMAAEGLEDSHRAGVIHRDIKPANIVVSKEGRVKVIDFGIALPSSESKDEEAILGSVHYISPEQAADGTADVRSDVYSLGATMYEMATGRPPFEGIDANDILEAHRANALVPPKVYAKKIFTALSDIIVKCLRKDPDERYQSMEELIADLRRCQKEPSGHFVHFYKTDEKKKESRKGNSKSRRKFTVIAATVLLALFLAAAAVIITVRRIDSGTEGETRTVEAAIESGSGDLNIVIDAGNSVPSLVGLSVDEAKVLLNEKKLSIVVAGKEYSDNYSPNTIIRQEPEEGAQADPGSAVVVTVSMGTETDSALAQLKGMPMEEAEEKLKAVGVEITGEKKVFSDDVAEGLVAGSEINPESANMLSEDENGETAKKNISVILLISAGKESDGVMMPNLLGLNYVQMVSVLMSSGLETGNVAKVPQDNVAKGVVTAQSQTPGELIKKGMKIDVQMNLEPDEKVEANWEEATYYDVDSDEELSPEYFYADIDTVVQTPGVFGPSEAGSFINVGIRLIQDVNGVAEYSTISEPRPIATGSKLPITIKNIRGAYGVPEGRLEVYDADTDTVIMGYDLNFEPRSAS
ncbi:MAG: protein kinase [Eubacteriales bacterium]|nr:protein kinase [Eubacteriales bacterium]